MNSLDRSFGRHIRSLRRARALSQEDVSDRGGPSADTVRRIEAGRMSPSLATLRRLCLALDLTLSVLFDSFELGELDRKSELHALLIGRSGADLELAVRMLRVFFDGLDKVRGDE